MAVNIGPKIGIDGEAEYRKELKAIIQETKTYAAETNEAAAAVEKADDKEKASAKVKESLAKQIEAQEKLVKKLREGVENAAKSTGENSETTLKWKEQLAKATTELHNLQGSASNAGGEVKDLTDAEKDAGDQASIFGDVLKANLASEAIKKGLELTKDALVAIKDVMVDSVKEAAAYGDEINSLSKKTGLSTQTLQQFDYMSDLIDVDLNTITGSLTKLTRNMDSAKDGTGAAAEAFETLGVSITDEAGNLRNNQDVWAETIDALGKIENGTERDALAMDLFGKSAQDLNPLILAGAETLKELQQEAENTGYVLDTETLGTLNDVQDGFDRLGSSWDTIKRQLGAKIGKKILPDLKDIVGTLQNFAKTGNFDDLFDGLTKSAEKALKKLPDFVQKITKKLPKVLKTLAKSNIWADFGEAIGNTLAGIFENLPALFEAGLELIGALIRGALNALPTMIGRLINGVDDGLDELEKVTNEHVEAVREKIAEIPDVMEDVNSSFDEINGKQREAEHWIEIFDDLSKKTDPTATDTERLKTAVDRLNELFPELGIAINEDTGKWTLNTQEIRNNIQAIADRAKAEAYIDAANKRYQEIVELERDRDELQSELDEIESKITEASTHAGVLQSQIDAVEALNEKLRDGEITVDDYRAAWSDLGIDFEPQFGSMEVYGEKVDLLDANLSGLNNQLYGTKNAINDLERQKKPLVDGIGDVDSAISDLNGEIEFFHEQADNLADPLKDSISGAVPTVRKSGKDIGLALDAGVEEGIKAGTASVLRAAGGLMKRIIDDMKDVAQIQSPSKVTEDEIGQNLALGVVKGWDDIFTPSNTREIFSLTPAFDAMTSSASETVSNVNNTQNYGGFEINVYAKDGQSVDELADVIMVKIQRAANARKAVFA